MAHERELTAGLLSKDANFRLIVSGNVGVKEIERLIKKLELDKEILADQDAENNDRNIQAPSSVAKTMANSKQSAAVREPFLHDQK